MSVMAETSQLAIGPYVAMAAVGSALYARTAVCREALVVKVYCCGGEGDGGGGLGDGGGEGEGGGGDGGGSGGGNGGGMGGGGLGVGGVGAARHTLAPVQVFLQRSISQAEGRANSRKHEVRPGQPEVGAPKALLNAHLGFQFAS